MSFGFTVASCGLNTACFKATNIALHCVNALLVYFLIVLLLRSTQLRNDLKEGQQHVIALGVAAFWALHPINVTTVLYAVQRMAILSTLFSLGALIAYCYWRQASQSRTRLLSLLSLILLCPLALLSKENGVLIPMFIFCIEIFLFDDSKHSDRVAALKPYLYLIPIVFAIFALALLLSSGINDNYENRVFSPWQRLLSEARVLFHYLYWIAVPMSKHYTLFHDDIVVSQHLLQPVSSAFAVVGLALISVVLWIIRQRAPLLLFAWAWFLVAHSLESSIIGLELVFEHRNYLALVGLCFAFVVTSITLANRSKTIHPLLVPIILIALLLYETAVTYTKASSWKSEQALLLTEVAQHPRSARLNTQLGEYALEQAMTASNDSATHQQMMNLSHASFSRALQSNDTLIDGAVGLLRVHARGLVFPVDPIWATIEDRLRRHPPAANTSQLLRTLVSCKINDDCYVDTLKLDRVYATFLTSPLNNNAKANALYNYAELKLHLGERNAAMHLIEQSLALSPNSSIQQQLSHLQSLGDELSPSPATP